MTQRNIDHLVAQDLALLTFQDQELERHNAEQRAADRQALDEAMEAAYGPDQEWPPGAPIYR